MKKIITVCLLLVGMIVATNLVTASSNNILEDPIGNLKASGIEFNIEVISKNQDLVGEIAGKKLPVNIKYVLPENLNGQSSAMWVLEDQINTALDKNSELHSKVLEFAKLGKPVVFVGTHDRNKVAEVFDSPIREIPAPNIEESNTNKRTYKTVAVWVRFNTNGNRDIGQVVIPSHYEINYNDILEATWIYRNGTKELRNRNNAVTKTVTQTSWLKPFKIKAAEAAVGWENVDSKWSKRRDDYIVYVADKPFGKLNLMYEFFQLTPDGNSTYDWFAYDFTTELVPSVIIDGTVETTGYGNYSLDIFYERTFANYYSDQKLYKYGPYNEIRQSNTSATVDIGTEVGKDNAAYTAGFTYTWNVFDLAVYNWSDLSLQKENHKWDFNPSTYGKSTQIVSPAISTRVWQGQNAYAKHYKSIYWWDGLSSVNGYANDSWFFIDNYNS